MYFDVEPRITWGTVRSLMATNHQVCVVARHMLSTNRRHQDRVEESHEMHSLLDRNVKSLSFAHLSNRTRSRRGGNSQVHVHAHATHSFDQNTRQVMLSRMTIANEDTTKAINANFWPSWAYTRIAVTSCTRKQLAACHESCAYRDSQFRPIVRRTFDNLCEGIFSSRLISDNQTPSFSTYIFNMSFLRDLIESTFPVAFADEVC